MSKNVRIDVEKTFYSFLFMTSRSDRKKLRQMSLNIYKSKENEPIFTTLRDKIKLKNRIEY